MRLNRLMRTNMSLRVKRLLLQRLRELFDVAMMFVDSFDVAMTVVLDVIQFIRPRNDHSD